MTFIQNHESVVKTMLIESFRVKAEILCHMMISSHGFKILLVLIL